MPFYTYNKRKIHYRERGAGQLMIVLPGNTASSASHVDDLSYFGQFFHAASMDFWGTGLSDRIETWPDDWWETAACDAAKLIETLGEDSAIIVGCSGGSAIALLMAILFPSKVLAVIVDSELESYPPELIDAALRDRNNRTDDQRAFWRLAHGEDWEAVIDADSSLISKLKDSKHMFSGRLGEIRCPVLLAGSLKDEFLPDIGNAMASMAKQIDDSEVFLVDKGGHPLMWTCQDEFRDMVMSFLRRKGICSQEDPADG